jgi:hypothetical protein
LVEPEVPKILAVEHVAEVHVQGEVLVGVFGGGDDLLKEGVRGGGGGGVEQAQVEFYVLGGVVKFLE